MRQLLADSFYYLALANPGDRRHQQAPGACPGLPEPPPEKS